MVDAQLHGAPEADVSTAPAPTPSAPPDALIIVPVRNIVLFPSMIMPITVSRPRSILAAQQAVREQRPVGVLMQRNAQAEDPIPMRDTVQ